MPCSVCCYIQIASSNKQQLRAQDETWQHQLSYTLHTRFEGAANVRNWRGTILEKLDTTGVKVVRHQRRRADLAN